MCDVCDVVIEEMRYMAIAIAFSLGIFLGIFLLIRSRIIESQSLGVWF